MFCGIVLTQTEAILLGFRSFVIIPSFCKSDKNKGTVTPKLHDLVFHLPRIARHLGTVGGVREDNLESKHAIGNSLRRRLACVRAEEEKLKLMLQLDEVQLRLKSAEFSKPASSRVRKRKNGTG